MASQTKPNVNVVWASGGAATPISAAKQALGWVPEVPDYDVFNGMVQQLSAFDKHVNQEGIAVWDNATSYPVNGLAKSPIDGIVYIAVLDAVVNTPPVTVAGGAVNAAWSRWVKREATKAEAEAATAGDVWLSPRRAKEFLAVNGSSVTVVSTPTIMGPSQANPSTNITLTAYSNSLLAGGSIASFIWTAPDGTISTVVATPTSSTAGKAAKAFTITGAIGASVNITVQAVDSAGNKSAPVTQTVNISNHAAPTIPTVTAPSQIWTNATYNTLVPTGSTASDGATITYEIQQSGAVQLAFSKTTGIAAGETVTIIAPTVTTDTPVTVTVTARDSFGAQSPARTLTITATVAPTVPGTPYAGGFYGGRYQLATDIYALVLAPKTAETNLAFSTDSSTSVGANLSQIDGFGASALNNQPNRPAVYYCRQYRGGGFDDWYLPAILEHDIFYRAFKPKAGNNNTNTGANSYSIPPGVNYTSTVPAQTASSAFVENGSQAFAIGSIYASSSTGGGANTFFIKYYGSTNTNSDGTVAEDGSLTVARQVRPARRVKIN